MSDTHEAAYWELGEDSGRPVVRLTGRWNLLSRNVERQRLSAGLAQIESPQQVEWDLTGVQILDSAGALVLWHAWKGRLPDTLHCRREHRRWFERLAGSTMPAARAGRRPRRPIHRLGAAITGQLADARGMLLLAGQLMLDLGYTCRHPRLAPWRELSASIYRTGATALPLLGTLGAMVGMVMTYQLAMSIRQFGANVMIVPLLGLSMMRELGPVITALIVVGRTGSSITAGVGVMHVTEELHALRAFGASPTQRLIMPKVIGMALTIPLLVLWTDFAGMVGGIVTADFRLDVGYRLFIQRLPEAVPWVNLWIGLGKGILFGLIIATVSGYFGLKVRASTESLRQETTNSVVTSLTLILILDAFLGVLLSDVGLV